MRPSLHRSAIETLLNTLEAERYMRGPLLATLADELSASGEELEVAARTAHAILERWRSGQLAESELAERISALRPLVASGRAVPRAAGRASAA